MNVTGKPFFILYFPDDDIQEAFYPAFIFEEILHGLERSFTDGFRYRMGNDIVYFIAPCAKVFPGSPELLL